MVRTRTHLKALARTDNKTALATDGFARTLVTEAIPAGNHSVALACQQLGTEDVRIRLAHHRSHRDLDRLAKARTRRQILVWPLAIGGLSAACGIWGPLSGRGLPRCALFEATRPARPSRSPSESSTAAAEPVAQPAAPPDRLTRRADPTAPSPQRLTTPATARSA